MKYVWILLGVLVVLFIASQIYAISTRSGIESYPFTVEKEYDEIEIRAYEASLFTTVKVGTKEYDKASSQGFSALAGYIFGGNDKNEKISMTSPVAMSIEENSTTMMFMVPKDFNKETLPTPNNTSIQFKEEPAKRMAAITFGGWASDNKIEKYKKKLTEALDKEGIKYSNKFFFLGYNPPFDLFFRKNEVVVELQ